MAPTITLARLLSAAALTLGLAACATVGPGVTNPPPGTSPPGVTNPPGVTSQPGVTNPPQTNPPGGSGAHACDLVTDAELKQVTGLDVAQKGPTGLLPVLDSQCDYEFAVDSVFDTANLTLAYKPTGGRAFYEMYFEPYIGDDLGLLEEAISGVGDKAAVGSGTIMAVKGDALIDIQWIGMGDNRDEEMPVKLAQLVLSKLP